MPSGDEDVTPSLDSSPSETTPGSQEQLPPQGDDNADAGQQPEVAPAAPPAAGNTPEGEANPDPVKDAIARLARKDGASAPAAPAKPSGAPPPAGQAPTTKPETAPASDASKATKPEPTLDDPYAGWLPTEQAKKLLKPQTRERIEALHHRWKDSESHPNRVLGNEFQGMLEQHQLSEDIGFVPPDHLAGLVRAQAAINRCLMALEQGRRPAGSDLQTFGTLTKQIGSLSEKLGIAPSPAAPQALQPYTGELSREHQDLISVFGMPEARVRLLAAIEQKGNPPQAAQPPAAPPAAPPPLPPDDRPEGVDMEAIHARRLTAALVADGVSGERLAAHIESLKPAIQQLVMREFPGTTPATAVRVFNALSPKERGDLTLQAHRNARAAASAPPVRPTKPPAPTRQPHTGQSPRPAAPDQNLDPVQSAIAHLARRDDGG